MYVNVYAHTHITSTYPHTHTQTQYTHSLSLMHSKTNQQKINSSACFTKAYGKFIKGTGSIVYQRLDGRPEEAVVLQVIHVYTCRVYV